MSNYPLSKQNRIHRLPRRGVYDREAIHAIIDEALVCHVAFVRDNKPCIIPTLIMREGDSVFIHGSRLSPMLKHFAEGAPACITVTHLDGLVLARSGFHHSVNYRSVVIHACGKMVPEDRKWGLLDSFVDSLVPGRREHLRPMTRKEANATAVVEFVLDNVSAKVRTGQPSDDAEDYDLPVWAGVLPLRTVADKPVTDTAMKMELPVPAHVSSYRRGDRPID